MKPQNICTIILYSLLIFITETSCNKKQYNFSDIPFINIEPDKAQDCYLEDIATNITCSNLQIPENYFFSEIIDIFSCQDSLLLFHDYYNKQIYLFNSNGKFINILNSPGRGPKEYINIETFTINQSDSQLIIYDHPGQKLISYTLPELKYIKHQRISKSLMSFAALTDNKLFIISDEDKNSKATQCEGAGIYNSENKKTTSCNIPNAYATINLSYPRTISFTNQHYHYICPAYHSVVYKITAQQQEPIFHFKFGNKNLPESLWKSNDALLFQNTVENNQYALMPQYFINHDSICSFFFFNGDTEHLCMVISKMQNNASPQIFKQIKLKGINSPGLKPLGVCNEKYVCLLYPHECSIDEKEILSSPISQMISHKLQNSSDEGTPVIIMFKPQISDKQ